MSAAAVSSGLASYHTNWSEEYLVSERRGIERALCAVLLDDASAGTGIPIRPLISLITRYALTAITGRVTSVFGDGKDAVLASPVGIGAVIDPASGELSSLVVAEYAGARFRQIDMKTGATTTLLAGERVRSPRAVLVGPDRVYLISTRTISVAARGGDNRTTIGAVNWFEEDALGDLTGAVLSADGTELLVANEDKRVIHLFPRQRQQFLASLPTPISNAAAKRSSDRELKPRSMVWYRSPTAQPKQMLYIACECAIMRYDVKTGTCRALLHCRGLTCRRCV